MHLLKKLTNRYHYLSTIITIVGLIWISNITACECNKDQGQPIKEEIIEEESGEKGNGSLVMTLTETNLVGPNKTAEVILKLSDKNKPATLKDFMLQVFFSEDGNDAGCQIKYDIYKHEKATSKKVSSVRENLTRLTTLEKLSPYDEPIKLKFTFNPKRNVTQLSATFQLLDTQGKPIQKGTLVTWKEKEEDQSINLVLERLTPENLQGRDKRVELKITNQGGKKIRAGEAKLKITRVEGDHAMVERALPTAVPNVYELALGELEPGTEKSTIETLTIIPGTDISTKLNFQLVVNNKPIEDDKVVITTWKAGVILALEHIKYDIINQEITYKITNSGTTIPKNLKLEYSTTTPGIKLDGEELVPGVKKTNDLASLHIAPRSSVETHVLGKLDLNKNKNANFEFKLVYEGGHTTTQLILLILKELTYILLS